MKSYRVCGLDPCTPFRPGPRSKKPAKLPVWAFDCPEERVHFFVGKAPEYIHFDLLVCERPHTHGKSSGVGLITMGVWAGWLAAQVNAERTLCMPPQVWKDILIPRFATVKKELFCANIIQLLGLEGLDPKVDADQDIIDAHGLCAVAAKLASEGTIDKYKKWELKL